MKTIFLFIPNYVYVTDLIRTGFIGEVTRDHKIVIYIPTLEYLDRYPSFQNVEYKLWSIKSNRIWGYMKLLRVGIIRKFDDLLSTQIHYKVGFKDWRRRVLRFLALCIPYRFSTDIFTKIETLIIGRNLNLEKDIEDFKPVLVATCSPGFTDYEAEAIVLCRKYKLPVVAVNFSWDNLTTNAKHLRRTNYLIVWNEYMKAEAIKYHNYKEDHVFISGSMRFDYYFSKQVEKTKQEFLQEKGLDPSLPLVIVTTTSHGVYPFHKELIQIIIDAREKGDIPKSNLLVRVHPKDDIAKYEGFASIKNVCVDLPGKKRKMVGDSRHKIEMENDDLMNLHATLKHADVAINYTSTITLEALACDTPVINIGFPKNGYQRHYEYIYYKPITDSGSVDLANTKEELISYICSLLAKPRKIDKTIVNKFFYMTDGNSYKRCSEIVNNIISKK